MFKYLFIYIIFSLALFGIDFNTTIIDEYYNSLCQALIDTSNSIDDYFIDSNISTTNKTEAELKTFFAIENNRKSEYAIRLRLRLDLPKVRNKLRLVLEDEDSDNVFADGTQLDNQYKIDKKHYFLRLDYFTYIRKKLNLTSGVGVKFKGLSLKPYINLKARYKIEDYKIVLGNRFRFYFDDKNYEDTFNLNRLRYFDKNAYILFSSYFGYKSDSVYSKFVNRVSVTKVLSYKKEESIGFLLQSHFINLKYYFNYPQLYMAYRDLLYKDWLYYELSPSILWREENNYSPSYRLMFSVGAKFKKN